MYSNRLPSVGSPINTAPHDSPGALLNAVVRLEQVVEQETAALAERRSVELSDFSHRKSHGLLELTRALRHVDVRSLEPKTVERVRALRGKLDRNRAALAMHLKAAQEVSGLVTAAIREVDSDGTYGVSGKPRGQRAW